ncbi:ARM repeat-containing protein [Dacryopinax primogenitus]|uniref:ARM repeat-containing protein n=1 Tax=Dacryopinax primogenitus (strain DJM 731) TaxID=1858805 RepID=M5FSH1_DACPD|nr:ARM repeat-containing protein [Dacryopinax primogenitus]EJT98823.1 ARM repeat-containing protein [Dacryopinax primogenitus]
MGDEKAQIAALNALSTLLSRNTPLITLFGRSHAPTAQTAYTLSRSRSPQVRLAACHILTSLLCHTTPRGLKGDAVLDPPGMLELAVLSTLQGLVEDGEDPEVRSGACWCLSTLVMDSPPRASHASQSGLLLTLCTLLRSFPSIGSTPEALDELYEESPSLLSLRESSMTCLASLTLPSVSLRTSLAALQPPVLPIIHSSLSHPSPGVRHAALQVIRALSRSVEVLRSSLVDEGVVKGVLGLVMRGGGVEEGEGLEGFGLEEEREEGQEQTDDVEAEGGDETMDDDALASANSSMTVKGVDTDKGTGKVKEDMPGEAVKGDRRVLLAALAALCNFSADFSPVQELLPEEHALPLLVQYATQPSDALLRLNGIWVLKNLVYRADWALKSQVMGLVGWSRFIELCRDPDLGVREQALSMVRNLAAGRETDVVQTVRAIGAEELVALVEEAMGTGNDDVQMNALFVLVNTLPELYRSRCMLHQSPAFLSALLLSLSSPSQTLRVAAIRAVHAFLQLSVGKQELREAGIERRVREMDGKPKLGGRRSSGLPALGEFGVAGEVEGSLEVRETVRKVVDFFEAA